MTFTDLDKTETYGKLLDLVEDGWEFSFEDTLTAERVAEFDVPAGGGLNYNWAAKCLDEKVFTLLVELAEEQEVLEKYNALVNGEVMNTGENRLVLHHLLRGRIGGDVQKDGMEKNAFYAEQLAALSAFAGKVHSGEIKSPKGTPYTNVVQIGIGGSDLGPRALYIALQNWAIKHNTLKLKAHFISNVDPDDATAVVRDLPLDETLFVLVSKSGTTQETLANETFVINKLKAAGLDSKNHMIAVTSQTSPLANNPAYMASFYMDDYIGGRYSSSSPVGGVILSLAFGPEAFKDILAGMHEADLLAQKENLADNAALLDAMIGIWERNFLMCPYTAILPYSQGLARFPAHLQQLDMESNGKRVNRDGEPLAYCTGPVVFGEPGTNGQHSFYQLLHQGTDIVPLQFIGFTESQLGDDVEIDGSTSQAKLCANLAAQITAFALGQPAAGDNKNKDFPGGRPSSLIYGESLTPKALGALLAHYENKVMFQGFIWNVNSFDQEGVQLGKILTKKVLAGKKGSGDPVLDAYSKILKVHR
jgi:glucose-6-phosphate isomerase